jgi:hypothetical protein
MDACHRLRWGCSSAGRAPALQAGGHRFDPVHLHQTRLGLVQNLTLPRFCLPCFCLAFSCLLASPSAPVWAAPTRQAIVAEKSSIRCHLLCHSQRRAGHLASLMSHLSGHCSLNCKSGSGASLGAPSRFLRWRDLSACRESDRLMPRCLTGKRILWDLAAKWPTTTTFRGVVAICRS